MSDLRERVIAAIKAKGPHAKASTIADAVMPLCMEEAARCAEREGVYPELNIAHGGPDWYRHGRNIAAAIRALANPASGS